MITKYRLQVPNAYVNGTVHSCKSADFEDLDKLRKFYSEMSYESRRQSSVFRITEEEIDIDKEDW